MIGIRPDLNTKNVLCRVNSLEIFKHYCVNFKQPEVKFRDRPDDKYPSCIVGFYNGDYLYKDFGKPGSYRAIPYVAYIYGVSYFQALKIINRDFRLGLGSYAESTAPDPVAPIKHKPPSFKSKDKTPSIIKIKRKPWSERELSYWFQYGWTKELLDKARIYPISHFWLTNPRKDLYNYKTIISPQKLAFSIDYYYHADVFRRKLYFPDDDKIRFISNVDDTIVQGYPLLDKHGDTLIVTSSIKDCGIFWRLGYNAIAPNTENEFFNDHYVSKLKKKWRRIIIWFDNDWDKQENPGVTYARKFARKYGLEYTYNPDGTAKDPSDYVQKYGVKKFKKLLNDSFLYTWKCTIVEEQ